MCISSRFVFDAPPSSYLSVLAEHIFLIVFCGVGSGGKGEGSELRENVGELVRGRGRLGERGGPACLPACLPCSSSPACLKTEGRERWACGKACSVEVLVEGR